MSVSHPPRPAARRAVIARDPVVARGLETLDAHAAAAPEQRFDLAAADDERRRDALSTCLMDLYRTSRDAEVFESLAALIRDGLMRRVRLRLRSIAPNIDPDEVLQDVLVNVYRYPDRFDGSRPGAFRAWSSMIVDNSIRRKLRRRRSAPELVLQPADELSCEPDRGAAEPSELAARLEACRDTNEALGLLLRAYLGAFQELNERERFVLQMVEVQGMRYAEIAVVLGVRAEALKMVVFRARRRIHDRLTVMFAAAGVIPPRDAAA